MLWLRVVIIARTGANQSAPLSLTVMKFSTPTASDITESDAGGNPPSYPSVVSETAPTMSSKNKSRYYAPDIMTVFKVEDSLFRIDRTLLDKETDKIPGGVGSNEDPIELEQIRAEDFEILLDLLSLGARYDKEPLTLVDWASVITVSSSPSSGGAGFDRDTYGIYFLIREKGTDNHLGDYWCRSKEGVQLQLWPRQNVWSMVKMSQLFYIDRSGALHHAASGLAVDIIDDVPVLRRSKPNCTTPNPWSHPLPQFSFVNAQIRIKFLSDPSLPSCTGDLYPNDSWATKDFLLATRPEKDFHMHPISDFAPWIPAAVTGSLPYDCGANHDKQWRVLVEERTEDVGGKRTSWEIVPANNA
ncbi:hypothetical protein HWV62_37163 [Athelia sp. TMB]|nr:hypothetical protein HWV62_37163 [Athelia sp. TMB]